uniref:Photoreceptor cilium actin regulator n=1 Tax=Pogona vitticeps TaxID=103695 RepID=A0ABM5FPE1_9SAUR
MGCTPSRSDIANHHVKHGVLPADLEREGFSLPLLIKSSSSYDTEEFCQEETQVKDNLLGNSSDEDKNVNFCSSFEDPSLPELDQEQKEVERTVSENEIAITELIESDKQKAEGSKIKNQDSCTSEKNSATLEDRNESSEKQNLKKGKKQKNSRQGKQGRHLKTKEKSTPPVVEKKVDFPDLLVKAHQNAYAYLNPNLSKYEVILCMANQATETQLIMQQMVSFLLFRFDEINHLLEEITNDGEDLLKEVGGHLAWPAGKGNSKEQPDLLQQLLQYTVNKMQVLNGTVASLTSYALQDSCSFLQSAGNNLEEKLKAKHAFDERLLRIIKLLEASAVGATHAQPEDMPLYSEDSGIGIDSESVKDLNFIDKHGMHADFDSCLHVHQSLNQSRTSEEKQWPCRSVFNTSRSHVCALEKQFKDIFYPPAHTKNLMPSSSEVILENTATNPYNQNIIKTPSLHPVHCGATHDDDCFKECASLNASSTNEDSDNSCSEEESDSVSLSAASDYKQKISNKRIDSPENEEIILKMKDAISGKIKFVPTKSGKKEWVEEDNGKGSLRPRTAARSQKSHVKQRRSRSEESLKSHGEDPTLLELQRTQKGLSKRLEMFYTLNGEKDALVSLNRKEPSDLQDFEHVTHRSSTNKLKASLAKNFNILPNQDKVPLFRQDQNAICQLPDERKGRKHITTAPCSVDLASRKENQPPGTQKLNRVDCAPPRKSVKKLIETFSPTDNLAKPSGLRTLGPIKCIRKFGLPSITPNLPLPRGLVPLNHKHRISPLGEINCRDFSLSRCRLGSADSPIPASGSEANEDSDEDGMENLPPPPPEMLIDTSSDSNVSSEGTERENKDSGTTPNTAKRNEYCTNKKSIQISARMKASLCSIDLLPSKNLSGPNLSANKATKNTEVDATAKKHSLELNSTHMPDCHEEILLASRRDQEMEEKTVDLHKQSHKIIPLQNLTEIPEDNGDNVGSKECPTPFALTQKRSSPDAFRKNENATGFIRRVSPARTPPASPPNEKRLPSPSQLHRHFKQASFSTTSRQPSPPSNSKVPSPPAERKVPSPPTQQNLSSPPMTRKQQSPPVRRKLSSPLAHRKEATPPPFSATPSPPASPSRLHKALQSKIDSGDEQQPASLKIVSNAGSIFCPVTASLFEAKPVMPTNSFTTGTLVSHPEAILATFVRRSSAQLEHYGNQQRKVSFSASIPQPFVRRSASDRRPGLQIPVPLFAASGSEPVLSQISTEDSYQLAGDSWNRTGFPDGKGAGKSFSYPELYVVGQGLHKD